MRAQSHESSQVTPIEDHDRLRGVRLAGPRSRAHACAHAYALALALAFFATVALTPTAHADPKQGPLLLVTQSELNALPSDVPVAWTQKPTSPDGPTIQIESPRNNATYEGPFPIKVEFLPGPKGHDVDLESLKLEYKKAWGIDITDRVRDYITGTVIDVDESELPRGRHTVEIEIADVAKNVSRQIFTVIVK